MSADESKPKNRFLQNNNLKIAIVAIAMMALLVSQTGMSSALSSSNIATLNQWTTVADCTYLIFTDGTTYYAKNCDTGVVDYSGTTAATVIQNAINALSDGDKLVFKRATYTLTTDVTISSDERIEVDGGGSTISGGKLKIAGTQISDAQYAKVRNFYFLGSSAGMVIDNTFAVTIEDTIFESGTVCLSVQSSNKWSEFTTLRDVRFYNCPTGIEFKTPSGTGTGSYANSRLDSVTFDYGTTGSYEHIDVQASADVSDSAWTNLRMWFNSDNGVGINIDGDATRTKLSKPAFESFVSSPSSVKGIVIGSTGTSPYFENRPVFISADSTWTNKISNANSKSLYSSNSLFRTAHTSVTVGANNSYGSAVSIASGATYSEYEGIPRIYRQLGGSFSSDTVTIEWKIVRMDGSTKTLTTTHTATDAAVTELTFGNYVSLTDSNYVTLMDHLEVRAKSDQASTSVTLSVGALS